MIAVKKILGIQDLKSDNLQNSTLGRSSHQPSVWWSKYYFYRLKIKQRVAGLDLNSLFLFLKSYEKIKKIIERIFAKNFARNYEKNNNWNITRLVDEMIVQSTQRIILKIVGFEIGMVVLPCELFCCSWDNHALMD